MEILSILAACFGLVHDDWCYRCSFMWIIHQMHDLHVTGNIFPITCYGIGTILPDCDCQHGIFYYHIYRSQLCVSDMDRFCWIWFFSFLQSSVQFVSLHECGSLWVSLENLQFSSSLIAISVRIFDWYSVLETCTGTWIFDWEHGLETLIFNWDPHTCRCGQNMLFYNC